MTGQRSNQLNYVPNLFYYLYRKPACLVAFLRFNRFACVALFNPENRFPRFMDTMDTKANLRPNCYAGKHQPRAAVPAPSMNCSRASIDPSGIDPVRVRFFCGFRCPSRVGFRFSVDDRLRRTDFRTSSHCKTPSIPMTLCRTVVNGCHSCKLLKSSPIATGYCSFDYTM